MMVKAGRLPGKVHEIELPEGATVNDALRATQIEPRRGEELRLQGDTTDLDQTLTEGDTLLILKAIEGNS